MDKYTFFWGGELSNWYPCIFTYKGIVFNGSEQAMMWEKAMTFGDTASATKILNSFNPSDQKKYGRKVKGYDEAVWAKVREPLVFDICYAKFTQDEELKAYSAPSFHY